jgi:hypothetical protein
MPLDLLFEYVCQISPLGSYKGVNLNGSNEKWVNSKFDIVFGNSASWILGFGRNTSLLGPDLKVVMDWSIVLDAIPPLGYWSAFGFGKGGATDLILANKDSLNYGNIDSTFSRKKHGPRKKERVDGWPSFWLVLTLTLSISVMITAVVMARVIYMGVWIDPLDPTKSNDISVKEQREKYNLIRELIQIHVGLIETRLVAVLFVYECTLLAVEEAKKKVEEVKKEIENISVLAIEISQLITETSKSIITNAEVPLEITNIIENTSKSIASSADNVENHIVELIDDVGSIVGLIPSPNRERDDSDAILHKKRKEFVFTAEENIKMIAGKVDKYSGLELVAPLISSNAPGSIIKQDLNTISIKSSGKNGSIILRQGTTPRNVIHLADGTMSISCGDALTGPSIVSKNGDMVIRNGVPEIGPEIKFSSTALTLTCGVSSLDLTAAGIVLKCGASKLELSPISFETQVGEIVSHKLSLMDQKLTVAENKMEFSIKGLTEKCIILEQKVDALIKAKVLMESSDVSAIASTKTSLTIQT